MPGPLTAEFPGQSAKLGTGHPGGVVDDRDRGIRALAGQAPGFQRGDQLVGIGHPQLGQAAQVGAVAVQEQPHPFLYRQLRGRDPVRRGLDLSRQPVFSASCAACSCPRARGDVGEQPVQLRDGLRLPVGDGLGVAPGPGENVGRWRLGGIQVGSDRAVLAVGPFGWRGGIQAAAFAVRAVECRDRCLVLLGAACVGGRGRGLAQRLGELVSSGAGPVRGLGRLVGVPPDLAGVPVPVSLLDLRRFLLAVGVLAELLEPLGVAHRGVGLQRVSGALPARCAAPPVA